MLSHSFVFPLPRIFTGAPLGNGRLGVSIWGENNRLSLTLGRSDWWEHRGGKSWTAAMNYPDIRACLEAGDEKKLREIFAEQDVPGEPPRSTLLPIGRFHLYFEEGAVLQIAKLDMSTGEVALVWRDAGGVERVSILSISMDARPVVVFRQASGVTLPRVEAVPSWDFVGEQLAAWSYEPPERLVDDVLTGWVQKTPVDQECCALAVSEENAIWIAVELSEEDALNKAAVLIASVQAEGLDSFDERNRQWWAKFWARVPRIGHANKRAEFLYYFGLYRFVGLTHPQGVPAGLQGPWIEDDALPPWSGDYHFNINVQMCYWPAYQAGLWDHLAPLFKMVRSWLPILRENARQFIGIDDGYILAHSVDDRCGIIGSFWAGTIDHACTAWVGKMMYDHWLHTGDEALLREVTYPYLVGAMRVYEAMLERQADGAWSLPVSVSPEYRGDQMNAWGRDASFQLAACHWLIEALEKSAAALGETPREIWKDIQAGLPMVTIVPTPDGDEIGLWDGLLLEESHRHHSHLASLYPFDTIDLNDPRWAEIVWRSHSRWVLRGMGAWSGWCMPWAAILHHRMDNPEAAELTLEIWERLFTNEGHASLHDVAFAGFSVQGASRPKGPKRREVMQMDGGMAAVAAVMDGLAHTRRGVVHLFTGVPARRGACAFENIGVEGGFQISAARNAEGIVEKITARARYGGVLRLQNPWKEAGDESPDVLMAELSAGDETSFLR